MNLAVSTIAVWLISMTPRLSYAAEDADYYSSMESGRFEFANVTNCTNDYCIPDADYLELMVEHIFPKLSDWVLIAMHSIVFVVGLVGNALVCMAVYRNHSMRTVTNYFIVNLAVADLLVLLICLPPSVLWDVTETWFLGLKLCKAVPYLQVSLSQIHLRNNAFRMARYLGTAVTHNDLQSYVNWSKNTFILKVFVKEEERNV